MVVNDLSETNWSESVMMNPTAPASNQANNISEGLKWCVGLKWGNTSTQISRNKGSTTDNFDVILLKLMIHRKLVNSYFEKAKLVDISPKKPC